VRPEDELLEALLTGPWNEHTMVLRLSRLRNRITAEAWMLTLAKHLLARWPSRPSVAALMQTLSLYPDPADGEPATTELAPKPKGGSAKAPKVRPQLPMSQILRPADLFRVLDVTESELAWFADVQDRLPRERKSALVHYRYRVIDGGHKSRLLEIPKPRLKEIQRRLARHCVARLALHPAAHGSVVGRSVRSCVAVHAGSAVLVRCDLESFFATVTAERVRGLISQTGADDDTARLVSGLCTSSVPAAVRSGLPKPAAQSDGPFFDPVAAHWRRTRRLAVPHLPQGAPTSPGLANAVTFSLDHRLTGLAASLGARYTRYVDDLIFSGPTEMPVGALLAGIRTIVADEGFRMAERKTAVLRSSRRQRVLGTVINQTPTIARVEIDRLRAILHNCVTLGVASQARDRSAAELRDQLQGTIAWIASIDAGRGQHLAEKFAAIDWSS
jgi:RNA-directed DNA polymerase